MRLSNAWGVHWKPGENESGLCDETAVLDAWHVDHRSVMPNMKILWLTFLNIIRPHGISRAGHANMPKFTGTKPDGH
jgi:hypothetical protein